MATIVTRAGKGSPLTHNEVDANFTNLNTAKAELASPALTGNVTVASNSATAAVTITQIGAGNALVVEDSASPDASPFVVTAAGNVGIGTTAPAYTLEAAGVTRSIAATGTGNPQFLAITSDAAGIPFVTLQNATSSWQNRNNGTTGDLSWSVSGSERMRITLGGNVGIGTSSPTTRVHALSTTGDILTVDGSGTTTGAADTGAGLRLRGHNGTTSIDLGRIGSYKENATVGDTAGYTAFFKKPNASGLTEAMRITSGGNVGIGTTSPSASLDVLTQVTGALGISLRGRSSDNVSDFSLKSNDAATVYGQIQGRSTDLRLQTGTALPITFFTNSAERLRIDSTGAIGIGGANYGTSGQTIVSAGSAAAPAWGYPTQLSTATGSAPSYSCRAWVKFNSAGGVNGAGNVSSVTVNATGSFTVNFTTAMPDANYSAVGTAGNSDGAGNEVVSFFPSTRVAAGSLGVRNSSGGGAAVSSAVNFVSVFR